MEIYVVRHGQVKSNIDKVVSGLNDESLTSLGIKQANEIKDSLKNIEFSRVYSSPVKRASQTANIIVPNKEIIYDERLQERNPGKMIGIKRSEINKDEWNSLTEEMTHDGVETLLSGLKRTRIFLNEIKKYSENDKILIVTHNFICKCLWIIINDITDKETINSFMQKNDEVKVYKYF